MAKQLNVSLNFTANTAQAKASMQELQRQLNSLTSSLTTADLPITKEVKEATIAAANLKVALAQSMNVDTGKFDLSKFNNTLKKSGTNLEQIHRQLTSVGADGRKAFMSLAQSIAAAEIPSKRVNSTLNQMWVTMKNTARWQLSSSALHAFSGALHSAFGYAKDLNESLNNIRIVTGQSTEQMAEFAEKANKAAKSLSTTTTKYTNASLIYYQQGLSDSEVQERTNATVKMANVTGENAQDVSSYMTAIWNNFDDGSKSMEYFADVITKLGAETAASSKEIAGGLEKFAAIGETVGLSYEYATAALTTIIDKTRQSEDVVGTALKTIFARIQGLKMGEETEDGLDLNKYSAALAQYGIDIFDANRNLKDMDVILDEMGAKWETLNRAQKVGLAQTVAGVRQYNQLVSLMDNWDAMEQNVASATGAEGSLDAQAKIYEESWQAASNRVRAAMEAIFSDLIEDESFIDLLNGLEKILSFTDQLIDSAGGLKGVLSAVSAIVFKIFSPQISSGLQNMVYDIKSLTGLAKEEANDTKVQVLGLASNMNADDGDFNDVEKAQLKVMGQRLQFQEQLNKKESDLSLIQREQIKELENINNLTQNNFIKAKEEEELSRKKLINLREENAMERRFYQQTQTTENLKTAYKNAIGDSGKQAVAMALQQDIMRNGVGFENNQQAATRYAKALIEVWKAEEKSAQGAENNKQMQEKLLGVLNSMPKATKGYSEIFVNATQNISSLMFSISSLSNVIDTLSDPNLSVWEKFSSITMSLTMAMPGLMASMKGLKTIQADLISTISASIIVQNTQIATNVKDIGSLMALEAALSAANNEAEERILLTEAGITGTALENIISAKKAGLTWKEAIAQEALNNADSKGIILGKISNAIKAITLGHILALVAAVAALVFIFKAIKNASPDEVLKRVSEETENAKSAADEAKNSYEDLKNTIADYNDSVKALEELTKGTTEFEEAVTNANNKVLELLDNYPQLSQYITRNNETGLLELSGEGQQYAQTAEFAKYQRANSYSLYKQQQLNEAENDVSIQDAKIDYASDFDVRKMLKAMNESNNAILTENVETIAKTINVSENVAQALKENSLELIALQASVNGNTAANDILTQEMARSALQVGLSNFENSKYQSAISARMAEISGEGSQNYRKAANEVNGYSRREVLDEYKDLTGQEVSGGGLFHLRKLKVEDENGEKKFIARSDAKDYITQQKAYENSGQEIEDYANNLEKLDIAFQKLGLQEDNLAHIRENLNEAFTSGEFQNIYEDLNQTEKDAIEKVWGENSSLIETIAGEHFDKYKNGIETAAENYDPEEAARQSEIRTQRDWDNATESLASSLELDQEAVDGYAKTLQKLYPELEGNTQATMQMVKANVKFSQGFDDLVSALDDNEDALKDLENRSWMTQESLAEVGNAIESMLGIEVSNSFVEEHLEEIKKLADGDISVLEELSEAAAIDYIVNLAIPQEDKDSILGFMNEVQAMDLDIGATATLDNSSYLDTINQMLADGLITADQIQSAFNAIGYAPEIDYVKAETGAGTNYKWETSILGVPLSGTITTYQDTGIDVPVIGKVTGMTKINTPKSLSSSINKNQTSSAKKSGGSKKDMERYHTVSNQLETLEDQYSAIGSAREQAFGADKLAFYDQEIEKLDQIIEKNKEYLSQIEKNLASDKAKMESYGAKFDENGDIINYRTIFKKYGQDENFQKALENYEESVDKYREKVEEINEELREWQSLNFERLNYVVELKLDLNEDELQELDYYYNKLGDDVYKSAECFALLKNKMDNTEDSLEIHKQAIADLDAAFAAGEISQADYIEGIREHKDAIYENLEALQEYEKQLKEFYGETLEKAKDELAEYIDQFDVLNNALEHYKNILELTGQEQDFEKMAAILESSAAVAEDKLAISAEWYEVQKQNLADLEAEYARTHDETIKAALDAQRIATAEAYEAMLSDAEEYAKALNDIYQNEVAAAQEALEKLLSGGLGFDRLNASMQHMSDIQDEYLTKTNQIYETNKLLNNLNNDINKTNNIASKQKLNAFAKEIEQLQEKDKLSNLELEIAQAKYKQLQAQIALEEAQNAKSIVRLSRDNEGNYGYVYTSDQEAISDAEQELADAENDLYNIRLKGANEYGEKVIQLNQWIAEELAKIDNDATLTQEQRNELKAELLNQYYEKLNMYTDLYGIAQEEDSRVVNDAWVNTYSDIILNGEECKNAITDYNEETNESFNNLQNNLATVVELAGTDLTTLQSKVDSVTSASESLRNEINTQVIPALDDELDRVKEQIIQHANEETGIGDLEDAYEKLCKKIQKTITEYTKLETAALEAAAAMAKAANAGNISSTPKGKEPEEEYDPPEVKYGMKQSGYLSNKKDGGERINIGANTNNTKTADGKGYVSYNGKWLLISDLTFVAGNAQGGVYKIPEKGSIPYYSYVAMDTGGYTGEWGPEGKLAMLHEKEIVLNQEDTSNILKVVEIVRAMIDANAANAGIGVLHSPGINTQNQNLEQTVTITAEFPNATNHNEIELAFDSLINRASQYANRK